MGPVTGAITGALSALSRRTGPTGTAAPAAVVRCTVVIAISGGDENHSWIAFGATVNVS